MHRSRMLFAACASLALAACATSNTTASQRLYEATGAYTVALTAATSYAESPSASPAIVSKLREANDKAKVAYRFTQAYRQCSAGALAAPNPEMPDMQMACVGFDFSAGSLLRTAATLRDAAVSLAERS
jgi:hypothetical protein